MADGAGNAQIASALGIAQATVQQHVDAARVKVGASNRSEMVSRAIGAGLMVPKEPGDTLMLLEELSGSGDLPGTASIAYVSASSIVEMPTLGQLLGSELTIRRQGDPVAIPNEPDPALDSTLFLEAPDSVHLHGRILTAFPPGSNGTLHRFGDGVLSLLIRPGTGSRPARIELK